MKPELGNTNMPHPVDRPRLSDDDDDDDADGRNNYCTRTIPAGQLHSQLDGKLAA